MENTVLEPRAERIARYKAERRRELAQRYGTIEGLPSKWVKRDEKKGEVTANSGGLGEGVNGRKQEATNGLETPAESGQSGVDSDGMLPGGEGPQLLTRVSVGHLRSALLQQTDAHTEKPCLDGGGQATSSLDLAVTPSSEEGRRRTPRYLPRGSGGFRKTSERFRTQPITAVEMEESSGILDADEDENSKDVKTDDRAKMSVAAKMSLFKELEKSATPEASSLLKPRSGAACHERRTRRGNDSRFLTQPVTCEEMVAISAPKPEPPVEVPSVQMESVEDGDESCKLSMSEKLALFNKLSLPRKQGSSPADGLPERRRQKGARYRTQPITVDEVTLLQKGPIQLPTFHLSPHLSDRQQALSANLKPSEVRLSQSRADTDTGSGVVREPSPPQKALQQQNTEPTLKGILKKSQSAGPERSGPEQNGGEAAEGSERQDVTAPPRRQRREAAPWRERARNRRETVACMGMRASSDQGTAEEERRCWRETWEQTSSSMGENSDMNGRVQVETGPGSGRNLDEEATTTEVVLVTEVDHTPKQETTNTCRNQEMSKNCHLESASLQSWEPVFASVYSISTPQYIMCFNQTNLSFEAQEVSSPTKSQSQPQWRQKAKGAELQTDKTERMCTQQEDKAPSQSSSPPASHVEVKEETPLYQSNMSYHDESPPSACGPRPCGPVVSTESEQDLAVLCMTNTPILTSAVAEHRRSVRPSRRTQGSRNPLRVLAAREDIRQDYMGEGVNGAAEERAQAEKKSKNSSDCHPVRSEDSSLDAYPTESHPPFSSLMLVHIKGRGHVQVRLVEPSVRSLNSGDCFLLVTPHHCILWSGEFANEQEKAKASELASFIQSQRDLGCSALCVIHLEEGLNSDTSEAADFWKLLGGQMPYRGAGAPEEDELYEDGVLESNCVYQLVENRLVPHEEAWASIPSTSMLGSSETLVFDFGSEVYLWCGRDVSARRRSVALQLTHQVWVGTYDYSNCRVNPLDPMQCNPNVQQTGEGRPSWAVFGVLSEHHETVLFREKFLDWTGGSGSSEEASTSPPVETQPLSSPSPDPFSPCDVKALALAQTLEGDRLVHTVLAGVDVQRGHGVITLEEGRQVELKTVAVDTWHVQEFDDSEIQVESTGQLHEGDSYVIRWMYRISAADTDSLDECGRGPKEKTAFFLWRGRRSSVSGRDTAAFLSIGMSDHEESQVVVLQGKEPPCFLQLFQGGLVIHKGKREEASCTGWHMFCVRGELPEEGFLMEVDCCCAGLRSRGSVVLLNSQQGVLYLWNGCKAHSSSREVGKRTVELLTHICPPELGLCRGSPVKVQVVEEGSEPADFWAALGNMDRKAYDCMLQDPGKYNFTPRLFHLSTSSGSSRAEELQSPMRLPGVVMAMPFVQESLTSVAQPALFLLDNCLEVYLWQRGQPEQTESAAAAWSLWHHERKCAMQTVLQYCKEMNPRRPPKAYLIFEGCEPLTFTNVFPCWERNVGPHTQGDDSSRVKLTLVQDALAQLLKTQYPLEELLQSPLPEGVDPQHLEVYLSDQDFQTILEMKRDEYASLPSWKQIDLKKSKGLLC
ncbi:supervillin isoform 2-T3 [Pholidichthys leucotaenia]